MPAPHPRTTLALILLGALLLRLPWMGESLWFDEYYTTRHTIGSIALLLKSMYSDIHPPAYYGFMWAWTSVFGDSEWSVRMPPLLCGLATIWLVAEVGSTFVNRTAGLWAAAIMAVSPVHVWYATEGRPYSTQLCLLLLTVLAFARLHDERPRRRYAWIYALSLSTLVFTHYYMAAYAVAFSVLAIVERMQNRRVVLVTNGVTLLLMAGYVGIKLLTAQFETGRGYLREFSFYEAWHLFYDWYLCGYALLPPEGVRYLEAAREVGLAVFQVCAVVLSMVGIRCSMQRREVGDRRPPGWHLIAHTAWLPLFLLILAKLGKDNTYIERSLLPSFPFFVLLLGTGIAALARNGLGRVVVGGFCVLQVLSLVLLFLERDVPTVYRPNPDWRAGAAWLGQERAREGDGLHVYTPYWSPDVLTYYDETIQQARTFETDEAGMQRLLGSIERWLGKDSWLYDFANSMIVEFETTKQRSREGMRITVYDLGKHDPREHAPPGRPFYVIYPGDYLHPGTGRLIDDPRVEEVEHLEWRFLRLHKLRLR